MASSTAQAAPLIELARVVRAHGLRGELLLKPFNTESSLLFELEQVLVRRPSGELTSFAIESVHAHGTLVLLALLGIENRDQAEALRGSTLAVTRDELPALADDEYYFVDLVGLRVLDLEGAEVGLVSEVLEYPASVCLRVVGARGELEIPHSERYVESVDLEAKLIRVHNLAELEELLPKAGK